MSTNPAPIAGGGGPFSIQTTYNGDYYRSKPPAWQGFYNSRPGAPNEKIPELSAAERVALIKQLWAAGAQLDAEIDCQGLDPYTIMYNRILQGWASVEPGTGLDTSTQVLSQGNSALVPGWIPVSLVPPAPYPVPPVLPTPPANHPKAANPVGTRMTPFSLNGLGDLFRVAVVGTVGENNQLFSGYYDGDTWTGTTPDGFSGTFVLQPGTFGVGNNWQMIKVGLAS